MSFEQVEIGDCVLIRGDYREILPQFGRGAFQAIITDPPFSSRTHRGHDASASGHNGLGHDGADRKALGYEPWTPEDADCLVAKAHAVCTGWLICMTDHVLAPVYHEAMSRAGRYVFAPLPFYAPGSRCRLSGDGPSSWTIWIVVGRTAAQLRWGTLPGGYSPRDGYGENKHMGGKPPGLMRDLVSDYSRRGDLICDPCMGSGTTLVAALQLGRRAVGIELDPATFDVACKRVELAMGKGGLFKASEPADLFAEDPRP